MKRHREERSQEDRPCHPVTLDIQPTDWDTVVSEDKPPQLWPFVIAALADPYRCIANTQDTLLHSLPHVFYISFQTYGLSQVGTAEQSYGKEQPMRQVYSLR